MARVLVVFALLIAVLPRPAAAQAYFDITITNSSPSAWTTGVIAVLPESSTPNAIYRLGATPTTTSGDLWDSYTFIHATCDQNGEDDGDAALLIQRWGPLTQGVNAWEVPALAASASHTTRIYAEPGEVMSYMAKVAGTGDDGVLMHVVGDANDSTIDLFNGQTAVTQVSFALTGFDAVNCTPVCDPPATGCVSSVGGVVGAGGGASGSSCAAVDWYPDGDGDGYGDMNASATNQCDAPGSAYVADNTDCDDTRAALNPATVWYADTDNDGFGDPATTLSQCAQPGGYVRNDNDCAPADSTLNPNTLWYADTDGDGFGDAASSITQCAMPSGHVLDDTDCDDTDIDEFPGAIWFADTDGDGFGDPNNTRVRCQRPADHTTDDTDCDDTDAAINPDTEWWLDNDGDGFGDANQVTMACLQPTDHVDDDTDCDDNDASANPGESEQCDAVDHDCDGNLQNNTQQRDWYRDVDGDGFGLANDVVTDCQQPSGYADQSGDCDDGNASIMGPTTYHADDDSDGFGSDVDTVDACTQPSGYLDTDGDCDDDDATVNPLASEVCNNADDDCDSVTDESPTDGTDWFPDLDGDGFGAGTPVNACDAPSGHVDDDTDCDDGDRSTNPKAPEQCDAVDHDCEGTPDNDVVDRDWYADTDGDGYGTGTAVTDCVAPAGHVVQDGDCDDDDDNVNPAATEVPDNDVDEDCDGILDFSSPELGRSSSRSPDTTEQPPPDDASKGPTGCACSSNGPAGGAWLLLLLYQVSMSWSSKRPWYVASPSVR